MQGVYIAQATITGVASPQTLLYCNVDPALVIEILSADVTVLDVLTNEKLVCEIVRVATEGSPAGTSLTPKGTENLSSNYSAWLADLTVEPTSYQADVNAFGRRGDSNQAGWEYTPLPEERPIFSPGAAFGLRLMEAISTSKVHARITFREIG
jgi:hypothetical protein